LFGYVYELDLSERDPKSMRESFAAFKELAQKYPESRYTEDAQARMRYLTNALGMYEVHVARYYYSRGAYIAAANRAQAALLSYPQTPSNEHALDVMERSYRKMGLAQLADDAHRILEKTYPQSVYIAGVPDKPWWKLW
jgi:outer membrane protein assembly factor BamD